MKRNTSNVGQLSFDFFENPSSYDFEVKHASYYSEKEKKEKPEDDELKIEESADSPEPVSYICFGSGSSGNSCYIGTRKGGVMIDAGVRPEYVQQALQDNGILPSDIKAVLLTHDHSDHVRYVYKMMRMLKNARLFCTNRVMNGLLRRHNISRLIRNYHQPIFKEIPFNILDFEIIAFEVPHDGTDNMGFNIEIEGKIFSIATDLGRVAERARHYMSRANYIMIESNYDSRMLAMGPYPQYLKSRIRTEHGHLDNEDAAAFLAEIAGRNLSHIFLCHLSKDNNTPEKALSAVRNALEAKGITVGDSSESIADRACSIHLMALPRFDATRLFILK